jgi:hypothetical protein
MDIRPIDPVVTNIEPTVHNDRERRQKRQPRTKPSPGTSQPLPTEEGNSVYKPNGEIDEEPPPNIDVLV